MLVLIYAMLAAAAAVHANGGPYLSPAERFLALFILSPALIIIYGASAIVGIVFGRRFAASWYALFPVFTIFPLLRFVTNYKQGLLSMALAASFLCMLAFAASEVARLFQSLRTLQDVFNRMSVIRKLLLTLIINGIFIAMPFLLWRLFKAANIWFAGIVALAVVIAILWTVGQRLAYWPPRPLEPRLTDYAWFTGWLVLFLLVLILS